MNDAPEICPGFQLAFHDPHAHYYIYIFFHFAFFFFHWFIRFTLATNMLFNRGHILLVFPKSILSDASLFGH